jgi:hypothetical protein
MQRIRRPKAVPHSRLTQQRVGGLWTHRCEQKERAKIGDNDGERTRYHYHALSTYKRPSSTHKVRLPRLRSPATYSGQVFVRHGG